MRLGPIELPEGRPALMGIVNVTPDSFSDGNQTFGTDAAIDRALRLVEEGADLIDVGGESSRPGAEPVPLAEELRRVIPVIEGIRRQSRIPISIDTVKSPVAAAAIEAGAAMVNDISAGRFDPAILKTAAAAGSALCLMHLQGTPRTMQDAPHYDDLIPDIKRYLKVAIENAVKEGVSRSAICGDPGICFGKTLEDNLTILRELRAFSDLGVPLLIGTSRKSFIGKLLNCDIDDRLEGTLATHAAAINGGAAILRVHDVRSARRFVDTYLACRVPD